MANTTFTAKSTFAEGLVMDFAPDNTQANTLTSALNATLLTFNGNEMSLQNDMGNGRVETAYLPEGYIPVGTCEFGDIIYIVSYNPIINKSQIGCFPSPERNISSEEIGGMKQSLKWTDFQQSNGGGPSGELVANSVKKVLYGSKDMTSGDKYIIYSGDIDSSENSRYLSDYGNTSHQHGRFPKLIKIHVVSIEESGKITYLDSSTKWYKDSNFYLQDSKKIIDEPDLDSYRTMVSSAYSIFSSKVSGKLALLVELEKITGFSCTWSADTQNEDYAEDSNIKNNLYSISWNFNWTTDNPNINPSSVVLTQSKWTGENSIYAGKYQTWEKSQKREGWILGGDENNWSNMLSAPAAFPNEEYYHYEISRVYNPESYKGSFDSFISADSYEAKSQKILQTVKENLHIPNVELTKVNLAGTNNNISNYYFNCQSSMVDDSGETFYYTSYDNQLIKLTAQPMSDDIINNTFNYPIVKKFHTFEIPVKQKFTETSTDEQGNSIVTIVEEKDININNLIYYYELTPAMPYGILRQFSQDGYIDFKKIGTKSIKLNSWRYYNYENTSTLTWGLEAYTEPNKGISEVVFLFYDNLGLAAAYHNTGKISYNGKFTEYFTLNTSGTNYKLNNKNLKNENFTHRGEKVYKSQAVASNTYLDSNNKIIPIDQMEEDVEYWVDDAGTIYSNCLYLVKIVVKYCDLGVLDNYIESEDSYIEDYRWYWSNTMFNDYYSVPDFKELQFNLNLDCQAVFETVGDKWRVETNNYTASSDLQTPITSTNSYKALSSTVQHINQDGKQNGNIRMAIRAGLQNSFNTFNIEQDKIENINVRIFLANEYIDNTPVQPNIKFTGEESVIFPGIYPTISKSLTGKVDSSTSKTLNELVGSPIVGIGEEMYQSEDSYENYVNNFHLDAVKTTTKTGNFENQLVYIDSNGDEVTTASYTEYKTELDKVNYDESNKRIDYAKQYLLTLSGIHHSKYYYNTAAKEKSGTLRSFVLEEKDLEYYSLGIQNNIIQFTKMLMMAIGNRKGDNTMISGGYPEFTGTRCEVVNYLAGVNYDGTTATNGVNDKNIDISKFLNYHSDTLRQVFKFLFPIGFGHHYGDNLSWARKGGRNLSSNRYIQTGEYSDWDLGGTLGAITTSGVIEPSDQYTGIYSGHVNALVSTVPLALAYLTQFFYVDSSSYTLYVPDNYTYLDTNSLYYKRDVVIELSIDTQSNDLIVFRGLKYENYLEKILEQFKEISNSEISNSAKNVKAQIYGCLKTSPLEFKFDYIVPEMSYTEVPGTYIQSVFEETPPFVEEVFQEDTIYYWNRSLKKFEHHRNAKRLYDMGYRLEGSKIIGYFTRTDSYVGIKNMAPLLTLQNSHLALSAIPNNYNGVYSVSTTKSDKDLLDGFKSGLKFYD